MPLTRTLTLALLLLLGLGPAASLAQASPLGWLGQRLQSARGKLTQLRQRRRVVCRLRQQDPLLAKAYRAMQKAHAPYSGVHVGAALRVRRQGLLGRIPGLRTKVVTGFNSESQGDLQLCAERAAMANLPRGKTPDKRPVLEMAVVSDTVHPTPCGRCLQVLSEVGTRHTTIVAAKTGEKAQRTTLGQLVPQDFTASPAASLRPYRGLIEQATAAYRESSRSGLSGYRTPFGSAVQTTTGQVLTGAVIKNTASTFTPATQTPLDRVALHNGLSGTRARVRTVVIAGQGNGASGLPVPTADERQHLVDMNRDAQVVLFNPQSGQGALLHARDLLPHAYAH